jgi:hypothetical protein
MPSPKKREKGNLSQAVFRKKALISDFLDQKHRLTSFGELNFRFDVSYT